jgi:hypothetical protein
MEIRMGLAFGKELGDFWKEKRKDVSVIPELIKRLEAKMLSVPGTEILMSKTEFTVGEWKLYLRAEGYPEWQQPAPKEFTQTDEHPVVKVSWNEVMKFCEWLRKVKKLAGVPPEGGMRTECPRSQWG